MSSESNSQTQSDEMEDQDRNGQAQEDDRTVSSEKSDDLAAQLESAQKKSAENWDLYVRAQAELENVRRRAQRDLENAHKYGAEKLFMELLPVKDSLELGLSASDADAEKLREGTELTLKMLSKVLEKFSVAEIDPVGETFDPNLHQAMTMQPSNEHQPNTVLSVMQKGYALNDRLLRPAMVVVSKKAEE